MGVPRDVPADRIPRTYRTSEQILARCDRVRAAKVALTIVEEIGQWPHVEQLRVLAEVRRLLGCEQAPAVASPLSPVAGTDALLSAAGITVMFPDPPAPGP